MKKAPLTLPELLWRWASQQWPPIEQANKLYEELGGEAKLGVTERQFRNVLNGTYSPSPQLFKVFFGRCRTDERKEVLLAYLRTSLGDDHDAEEVLRYVDYNTFHLPDISEERKIHATESNKHVSLDQLYYLIEHRKALRLLFAVILGGAVPEAESGAGSDEVDWLVKNGFLKRKSDGTLWEGALHIKIPNEHNNSGPESIAAGREFMLATARALLEVDDGNDVSVQMQIVVANAKDAAAVLGAARNLKYKIASLNQREAPGGENVIIGHISVTKILSKLEDLLSPPSQE